jgi:hypothetical protein
MRPGDFCTSMVLLQNKCKVRGSPVRAKNSMIHKLAYNMWIKNIMVICNKSTVNLHASNIVYESVCVE